MISSKKSVYILMSVPVYAMFFFLPLAIFRILSLSFVLNSVNTKWIGTGFCFIYLFILLDLLSIL